jgi:hypothetical protein
MSEFMSEQELWHRREEDHQSPPVLSEIIAERRRLDEMAETYYTSCDAYDARVCTGKSPITGEPMPMTPREQGLVSRHAREVREGLNGGEFHEAITRWYDLQPMKGRRLACDPRIHHIKTHRVPDGDLVYTFDLDVRSDAEKDTHK